jgi:hypothetical protein
MLYEIRTYGVQPHSVPEVEKRFGEAYEARKKYSELAAFWHTEIGPLNQIIHVWGYKDLAERDKVRAAAVKDGALAAEDRGIHRHPAVGHPASVLLRAGDQAREGRARTSRSAPYTYKGGELPIIQKTWEAALPGRLKFGPIVTCGYTDLGALSKFIHIWPYKSLDERTKLRDEIRKTGNWPPSALAEKSGGRGYHLHAQENKVVMPSAFSPVQ